MPYVDPQLRALLAPLTLAIKDYTPAVGSGPLNYLVTKLCVAFLGPNPSYSVINAAIGALECAKMELYRRVAAPYEDNKIKENGDVY